jgi:hypothetical protein
MKNSTTDWDLYFEFLKSYLLRKDGLWEYTSTPPENQDEIESTLRSIVKMLNEIEYIKLNNIDFGYDYNLWLQFLDEMRVKDPYSGW